MLLNIKELYGNRLAATDGDIGHVQDFLFDDKTWAIRYLVVDTGLWLGSRLVLISPQAFGHQDSDHKVLHVNLTKRQIECSPALEWHQQVSREYEIAYYHYYGWAAYWEGGATWGFSDFPVALPPSKSEMENNLSSRDRPGTPLRSTKALKGHHILATDRAIGSLKDVLIDARSWAIHKLVVEAGHWYAGKEIHISPSNIALISYETSEVFVDLSKSEIQQTAEQTLVPIGAGFPQAKSC
jgi:sporulation protein YlmC with PRC-barrel domain